MSDLLRYATELVRAAAKTLTSGEVFAKVLTPNDDSGRHGVLVPSDAYSFFPELPVPDPTINVTGRFPAFDAISGKPTELAYKYYERYPERRITRLHGLINDRVHEPRLVVFLRAQHPDGTRGYYFDCANAAPGGRFSELFDLIFGREAPRAPGSFVLRPVDSAAFAADASLKELLRGFDDVREQGWIGSLREGDTGIGYTFETLLGIKENNDKLADFKGIEIKCKGMKEGTASSSGKINLFQAGPVWHGESSARDRIHVLGKVGGDGLYSCHSQVTESPNNLGLSLEVLYRDQRINLRKEASALGYWTFDALEKRLVEKHSRAVFVKASTRDSAKRVEFRYEQLVYCEQPSIGRFMGLVRDRNIVFEFLMSEKIGGSIRNHGYPWRLTREEFLEQLFSFQIRLR